MCIRDRDTVAVMIRRIRAGHSPFAADRQHLHYLLLGCGLSDGRATALLLAMALMSGAAGVVAHWLNVLAHPQFYAFLALFGLYYWVTTRLWERQRLGTPLGTIERRNIALHSKSAVMPVTAFHPESAQDER